MTLKCFLEFFGEIDKLMLFLLDVWSDKIVWLSWQITHLVTE